MLHNPEGRRVMKPQAHTPCVECRCAGEPYDLGFEQGRALRHQVSEARRSVRASYSTACKADYVEISL